MYLKICNQYEGKNIFNLRNIRESVLMRVIILNWEGQGGHILDPSVYHTSNSGGAHFHSVYKSSDFFINIFTSGIKYNKYQNKVFFVG